MIVRSFAIFLAAAASAVAGSAVDFGRDVFPILQRSCFECHGAEMQKGKLRLDERDVALAAKGVIVPGSA